MPDILHGMQWVHEEETVEIPDWTPPEPIEEVPAEGQEGFEEAEFPQVSEEVEPEPELEPEPEPEPEPLTEEQLRELYRPQWEQDKTIAQQHAYQDVMNEYRPALENCIQEMNQHLARLDEVHDRFIERFGAELKYLAVDIAEKWILQRIPANDDLLEQMVMQAVNTVKDCKWMDVQLSEQMVGLSEKIQKQLASPEYGGRAQVSLHKTDPGSCVIQTEAGELDVSVSTQAQQLKKLFRENT